jgi:anti-sigma-K factor RskA
MARTFTHKDLEGLLGAYALDAVDVDEAEAVELHLRDCPRCRAEVADHRDTAALLASAGAPAPEGVWDRIASTLEGDVPPRLAPVVPMRRRSVPVRWMASAVAVAAVVVALLGISVVHQSRRIDRLGLALQARGIDGAVNAALLDPHAHRVALTADTGGEAADAVVLPNGTGYLVSRNLPRLSADKAYQLWAVVGSEKISLGVLGNMPHVAPFSIPSGAKVLALTVEAKGGVVATDKPPVVRGFL